MPLGKVPCPWGISVPGDPREGAAHKLRTGNDPNGAKPILKNLKAVAADGRIRTWVGLEHLMYCTKACFAQAVGRLGGEVFYLTPE